jgi:hypothetical protein
MATYDYRRRLSRADELKAAGAALGAAAGVAVVAWYLARILLQRTPVLPAADEPEGPPPRRVSGAMLREALRAGVEG